MKKAIKPLTPSSSDISSPCPKCGAELVETRTRSGRKLKKCSTNVWDPKTHTASGCDYVEWAKTTTELLDDECPTCSAKLIMVNTSTGKQLRRCSTSKWDKKNHIAEGCAYVQWVQ